MSDGVAIVTGAAQGIGLAIAQRFIADGRRVVAIDRVEPPSPLSFPMVSFDLSDTPKILGLVHDIEREHGPIDALVNVAGIYEHIDPANFSLDAYRRVLAVDLDAPIVLGAVAGELMASRGFGRIVNVTSIHGEFGERGGLAYDAAKGGLNQATRTLALEFAERGVLCNAVAPGFVDTQMAMKNGVLESTTDDFRRVYVDAKKIPLARPGQPHEISGLVAWLCSPDNTYVTGQVFRIDGGMSATF
jgi:NAD(P)-dependent dehydrogenase (short-subunit alcohol dehydrogenase family)